MPTDGELFTAFLAGLAIGAFALHAWRTWREVRLDETLFEHYRLTPDQWDALSTAEKNGVRAAFLVAQQQREADRG